MTKKRLFLVLVVWAVSLPYDLHARQLAIIADKTNPTTNLTAAELVNIFSARTWKWPGGKPIVLVVRDPWPDDMQLVLLKLLKMTSQEAHAFIQAHHDAIMVADSDDAVLRFVSTLRGAIGVVDLYSLTQDVSVVKIDGKLPVEQGYLLRGN